MYFDWFHHQTPTVLCSTGKYMYRTCQLVVKPVKIHVVVNFEMKVSC